MKADEHLRRALAEVGDKLKETHPGAALHIHTQLSPETADLVVDVTDGPGGRSLATLTGQSWSEEEPVKITYHES